MKLYMSFDNRVELSKVGYTTRQLLSASFAVLAVGCIIVLLCIWQDTALAAGQAATQTSGEKQTAKVLIVTGIDHPAHNWRKTAPVLAEMLRKDKRLEVRLVEDPHFLDSSALERYDVVVLHFMDWQQPAPGPKARANLQKCVRDGRGLFVVHFGCGAFQDWPEFRNLAGRVWDPKARAHDPYGSFRVEITDLSHPITKGMKSFEIEDELYTCLTGDRPVDMLATARSKVDNENYPMAFAFSYGKGRVFHSALGHDVKAISNPDAAELFRRGCAWAATLTPVPETQNKNKSK